MFFVGTIISVFLITNTAYADPLTFSKTLSSVIATPNNTIEANNTDSSFVTVNLKDVGNANLALKSITLKILSGPVTPNITVVDCDNTSTPLSSPAISNANGNACFKITSIHPGEFTFQATNETDAVDLDDPEDIPSINFVDSATYINQSSYRWRNDDGDEANATSIEAENTPIYNGANEQNLRLRIGLKHNGANESKMLHLNTVTDTSNNNYIASFINQQTNYGYYLTASNPATIVKYDLENLTKVQELTFSTNGTVTAADIDQTNNFGYIAVKARSTSPTIIKLNLGTGNGVMSESGVFSPGVSSQTINQIAIDENNNLGYAITSSNDQALAIIKFKLPTLTQTALVNLNTVNNVQATSKILDSSNKFMYLSTNESPVKILKIDLNTDENQPPQDVNSMSLESNESVIDQAAAYDSNTGYAYFGTKTTPAKIIKIDINPNRTFQRIAALTLNENGLQGNAILDSENSVAYFANNENPAKIIKIDLSTFTHAPGTQSITLLQNDQNPSGIFNPKNGIIYYGLQTSPAKIYEIATQPIANFKLEQGSLSPSETNCASILSWSEISTGSNLWKLQNSTNINDGDSTTNVINLLSDTKPRFRSGKIQENTTPSQLLSIGRKQFTEMEYSLNSTVTTPTGTTYCLRTTNNISPSPGVSNKISYTNYAKITLGGITVNQSSGSTDIIEGTNQDTYTLGVFNPAALNTGDSVEITLTAPAGLTINPSVVTLTQQSQIATIKVTAQDNSIVDGTRKLTISHNITASNNSLFSSTTSIAPVIVTLTDYGSSSSNTQVNVTGSITMTTPTSFSFPSIASGAITPNFFRAQQEGGGNQIYQLQVEDGRGPGTDFQVQVQASSNFSNRISCIPLSAFYVGTSNLSNSLGFNDTIISPTNINNPSDATEYTNTLRRFGSTPSSNGCGGSMQAITLLDTTLTNNEIKGITTVDVNYLINYPEITEGLIPGDYQILLTFTKIES